MASTAPKPDNDLTENPTTAGRLLNSALECMRAERHEDALSHLNQLIALAPENAQAFFLRGAERAELGQFDHAIDDLRHSVQIDATLWTAHFELGLIHFMRSDYFEADNAWGALGALPAEASLRLFAQGLMLFAQNRAQQAADVLHTAISKEPAGSELSRNMRSMLSRLTQERAFSAPSEPKAAMSADPKHVLLNNYDALVEDSTIDEPRKQRELD